MGRLKALQGVLAGSVATAVLAFGTPSPAARAWMDGAELVQRFGGATIDGRYASGKVFTERYESRRPSDLHGAQPDVGRPLVGYRGHAVHDLRWRCVRGLLPRRPRGAELL